MSVSLRESLLGTMHKNGGSRASPTGAIDGAIRCDGRGRVIAVGVCKGIVQGFNSSGGRPVRGLTLKSHRLATVRGPDIG